MLRVCRGRIRRWARCRRREICHADVHVRLDLAQEPAADVMLRTQPLALLVGMLARSARSRWKRRSSTVPLAERLGVPQLDAAAIADHDPVDFAAIFTSPRPSTGSGGDGRAYAELCRAIADTYGTMRIGLVRRNRCRSAARRVEALPGFGRAEGADLRRAAGQGNSTYARTAAGHRRRVWPGRLIPVGRRYRRPV